MMTSLHARVVMQGKEGLGPRTRKGDLSNGVIDLVKSSRGSSTMACHTMDQRNTNEEVGQMDDVIPNFTSKTMYSSHVCP
jgi:hypothetical protein